MRADDDGETLEVILKNEMFDEGLLAAGVEIAVAQRIASAGCEASISSMTARRR